MSVVYRKHDLYPESIIIRDFSGKVSVDEIIQSWDYLIQNNMITPAIKGVINNMTGCELEMTLDNFKYLTDYLKKQDIFREIKLAVISDDPKLIVFPYLGEINEQELKIKPFTTSNAAEKWILNEL